MRRDKAKHCFAALLWKICDFPILDMVIVVLQKILFKEFSLAKLKLQCNFLTLLTLKIRDEEGKVRVWETFAPLLWKICDFPISDVTS